MEVIFAGSDFGGSARASHEKKINFAGINFGGSSKART